MRRVQYGEYDGTPPEIVIIEYDDETREVFRQKGEEVTSTRSESERQFELELINSSWPVGTHIVCYGPGEQRFDAVL